MAVRRPTSHLSALLLIGLVALAAPALFRYTLELWLPLVARLLTSATSVPAPPPSLLSLLGPLCKLLGLMFALAIAAEAGALGIRRALSR